ncbi:MAG: hypothetical protein AAB340_03000 [Patescibacteria group bacterium]
MKQVLKISFINYNRLFYGFLNTAKKVLWFLARDVFLIILILILLTIVFGELLFYNYVLSVEIKELNVDSNVIRFQKNTYKSVVEEWARRENIFNNPSDINYRNPF